MRNGAAVLIVLLALASPAAILGQEPGAAPPGPVTVGEFAIRLVQGLGLEPAAGPVSAEAAAWILSRRKIVLRPDLNAPLTEADAVAVLQALGFRVRTTTPSRVMSRDRLDILAEVFIRPAE